MFHNSRITDWQGQVVWLVGAHSAFDHALARELQARGAQLVLSGDAATLKAFPAPLPGLAPLALDWRQRGALTAGCTRIVREHGRLDVVIRSADAPQASEGDRDATVPEGVQHLLDTVVPLLLRQGHGHLCLVAGEGEARGGKGPTRSLVERLRAELAPRGLGVSSLHPESAGGEEEASAVEAAARPNRAARIAVECLAAGQEDIEAPRRPSMWERWLGRTAAAQPAKAGRAA